MSELIDKRESASNAVKALFDKIAAFRESIWKSKDLAKETDALLDELAQELEGFDIYEGIERAVQREHETAEEKKDELLRNASLDFAEAIEQVVDATPDAELRSKLTQLTERMKEEAREAGNEGFDTHRAVALAISSNAHRRSA